METHFLYPTEPTHAHSHELAFSCPVAYRRMRQHGAHTACIFRSFEFENNHVHFSSKHDLHSPPKMHKSQCSVRHAPMPRATGAPVTSQMETISYGISSSSQSQCPVLRMSRHNFRRLYFTLNRIGILLNRIVSFVWQMFSSTPFIGVAEGIKSYFPFLLYSRHECRRL